MTRPSLIDPIRQDIREAVRAAVVATDCIASWASSEYAPDDDTDRRRAAEARLFDVCCDACDDLPDAVRGIVRDEVFRGLRAKMAERIDA